MGGMSSFGLSTLEFAGVLVPTSFWVSFSVFSLSLGISVLVERIKDSYSKSLWLISSFLSSWILSWLLLLISFGDEGFWSVVSLLIDDWICYLWKEYFICVFSPFWLVSLFWVEELSSIVKDECEFDWFSENKY